MIVSPQSMEKDNQADQSAQVNRRRYDNLIGRLFFIFSIVPIGIALLITSTLIYKSSAILSTQSFWQLLTGQVWRPDEGLFGFLPFILGTTWVTGLALIIAVPPCLLTAIYLSEYAGEMLRRFAKPLLDLLASIPSVVYGVWGVIAIVPFIQKQLIPFIKVNFAEVPFLDSSNPTGFGILAGAIVLAVMITPFIVAIIYEIMNNIPKGLKEASLAMGATQLQTVRWVVIPQSLSGILAAIVLGASRALGETMAVLMVVGNVAKVPQSILDPAYPLPALIANHYGEMMSIPLYESALMTAALILLVIILIFNIASAMILRRILGMRWV